MAPMPFSLIIEIRKEWSKDCRTNELVNGWFRDSSNKGSSVALEKKAEEIESAGWKGGTGAGARDNLPKGSSFTFFLHQGTDDLLS